MNLLADCQTVPSAALSRKCTFADKTCASVVANHLKDFADLFRMHVCCTARQATQRNRLWELNLSAQSPLSECLFLHLLHEIAKISHATNQARLLSLLTPVGWYRERFEVVLDPVAFVSFGFESIESHPDIPA